MKHKVKVTVLDKKLYPELQQEYCADPNSGACPCYNVGDELHIPESSVDFILTSPPYANLLKTIKGDFAYKWREHSAIDPIKNPAPYSTNDHDIGNMEYNEGIQAIASIMKKCFAVQKNNTYAVWIVKDFRDLKRKIPYINFHGDVIRCAESAGYTLWDIRIYDQTNFRPLVCLGYPSRNYYLNIGHSYMLVFKKTR